MVFKMVTLISFLLLALVGSEVGCQNRISSTRVPLSSTVTTVPTPSTSSTNFVQDCIRTCPVTSEYNPVCGSNSITYDNPGRLLCAQACGVTVNLLRMSRCPPPTPAPTV